MPEASLTLSGVTKTYPGVRALADVSLALYPGVVTALVGENGAGKSTLVKCLTGLVRPDAGDIRMADRPLHLTSPRDAWDAGITAIHQETVMFDELSVAENVFAGRLPRRAGMVDWAAMTASTTALLARLNAPIRAREKLRRLSVAQKHLVQIARALAQDSRVVIMDEPTAALSAREVEELLAIVRGLRAEGRAILFITHKFEEIFSVADRWVCLRDGRHVGQGGVADITQPALVSLMVGRAVDQVFPKRPVPIGDVVLEVAGLANATEFADISLTLRRGEILGLYGLVGAGRSEAMQALFGLTRPTAGTVRVDGRALHIRTPADAIAAGLAYVPEDRQVQGAVLPFSVRENVTLADLAAHVRHVLLSRRAETATAARLARRLDIRAATLETRVGALSGGNQQKVVIARWLARAPRILILDEPTKGIDIGAKAAVHDFMVELAGQGMAVILISSELPEMLGMADRVLVMRQGRIVAAFDRGTATAEAVAGAALG